MHQVAPTELVWHAPDGSAFGVAEWAPPAVARRAVVVAMHGLSGRAADFEPLGGFLAGGGYATCAWNLRGQGLDPVEMRRGAFLEIAAMLGDLGAFADFVASRYPGEPMVLYGDSMGALLAIRAAATPELARRFAALVLAVPVVDLAQRNPPWLKALIRLAAALAPRLRIAPSLFVHGSTACPPLTRIAERQNYVENAPYRLGPLTLPFLLNLDSLMATSFDSAAAMTLPALVLYGGKDVYTRPAQIEAFFARVASPDKSLRFYPDGYHQLLFDLDRDAVLADIVAWLDARFAG